MVAASGHFFRAIFFHTLGSLDKSDEKSLSTEKCWHMSEEISLLDRKIEYIAPSTTPTTPAGFDDYTDFIVFKSDYR